MKKKPVILIMLLIIVSDHLPAQQLTAVQTDYLKRNISPVCKDEAITNTVWNFNFDRLKDKRIVMLGEFSHGSKEIFLLRNELIKWLHENMGFNVVLFESGIGELAFYDLNRDDVAAAQMVNGLFANWRTKEIRSLMEYMRSANISIAGFDVQRTGGAFDQLLHKIVVKNHIDSSTYKNPEGRYGLLQRELNSKTASYDSVKEKVNLLIVDYKKMHDLLQENNKQHSSTEILITLRTIENRIKFLEYMLQFVQDHDWNKRWEIRDSMMAGNVEWLAENIYRNKKIILVGHNYHIAQSNQYARVMGHFLEKKYGAALYSIGFFAGTGIYLNNSGIEASMSPVDTAGLDIKTIIKKMDGFAGLLPIPGKAEPGAEWLFEDIIVNDSFTGMGNTNKLIPAKQFNGLLLIQKSSVPEK